MTPITSTTATPMNATNAAATGSMASTPASANAASTTVGSTADASTAAAAPTAAAPTTAAAWLADGFASHAAQWAIEHGAAPEAVAAAERAARQLSLATGEGHVCMPLAALSGAPAGCTGGSAGRGAVSAELRALLLASGIVGTPAAPYAKPLILDDEDRLYLHRHFDYERRLAHRLSLPGPAAAAPPDPAVRALLQRLYAANTARLRGRPDWQKIATALALERRLTIISGGPGTGKTTAVVNLIACLLAENPKSRIALAAPTGKAAARMLEAIRSHAAQLPPEIGSALPDVAYTVHRLLGATPGGFRHDARHLLALDALIVDEASMLDLALATQLFEALPDEARIVLLGDKDQLSAVEAGAVFAELGADPTLTPECRVRLAAWCELPADAITPPPAAPGPLPDSTVWFREHFRFAADTGIGRLAAEVRAGQAELALETLRASTDSSLVWIEDAAPQPLMATLQHLAAGYDDYLAALCRDAGDIAAVSAAFGRFRILCALRAGPRGVEGVNRIIERHVRQTLEAARPEPLDARSAWYSGRPVMVLRNDPVLQLYNGDIGIALPDAAGRLMVWFAAAASGPRPIAALRLPPHQTAYAMTVHKAQGSEFDAVALLLPAEPHRVASRELLYTALTRARTSVTLIGGAAPLRQAIATPTERHSGLLSRLREASSA